MYDKSIVSNTKLFGPLGGALLVKNLRKSAFSMPWLGINKMITVTDTDSGNQTLNRIRVNIYSYITTFSLHHSRASHSAKISICNENVATWRPGLTFTKLSWFEDIRSSD